MAASDHLSNEQFDYRVGHRPTPAGAEFHDAEQAYPDVYEHPEYYRFDKSDDASLRALRAARGKPEAPVTIYRSVPGHVDDIHEGDWVTPSRSYADNHGRAEKGWKTISKTVPAKHVRLTGDHVSEAGYFPQHD